MRNQESGENRAYFSSSFAKTDKMFDPHWRKKLAMCNVIVSVQPRENTKHHVVQNTQNLHISRHCFIF